MNCSNDESTAAPRFGLSFDGRVHFVDDRVSHPVSFAHVGDLHLPPHPPEAWPPEHRKRIEHWDTRFGHPREALPRLLDDIRAAGVDFVFFGGDTLDVYQPGTAGFLVEQCRARDLTAHFQIGNHDWQDMRTRYRTHELDRALRAAQCEALGRDWSMPGLCYSFEQGGVRFVSLDVPYGKCAAGYAGFLDAEHVEWLAGELAFDGPIVVFHHVPFRLPTLEHRLRYVSPNGWGCVTEDENGRRVRAAIEECPNILGTFTAHMHFRSEDPIGRTCQFMAPPAHAGQWRFVRIAPAAGG